MMAPASPKNNVRAAARQKQPMLNGRSRFRLLPVAFSPDGKHLAVAGTDGRIRLLGTGKGEPLGEFDSVPLQAPSPQR